MLWMNKFKVVNLTVVKKKKKQYVIRTEHILILYVTVGKTKNCLSALFLFGSWCFFFLVKVKACVMKKNFVILQWSTYYHHFNDVFN